jgi:hypothetical protein
LQIDIPGGKATLRDTLTIRERREIQRIALDAMGLANQLTGDSVALQPKDAELLMTTQDKMADATLIAYLKEWTLGKPLPTLDTIDEMDGDVYDAITAAIEKNSALAGVDTSPAKDPLSPTRGLPLSAST